MTIPKQPKIYHILHVDRLSSIITDGNLWCDAEIINREHTGTNIGMNHIKRRRLEKLLASHPNLHVGECVPFYFCPRSIMLYIIHQENHPDLEYRGGQSRIIHLEADLYASIEWAENNRKRWAFTLTNAGSSYFEDYNDISKLNEKINWNAIGASQWSGEDIPYTIKEYKQAEFLMEFCFPWHLIERIGVFSKLIRQEVQRALNTGTDRPQVEVIPTWYY